MSNEIETVKTEKKQSKDHLFKKGDARINRNGRPKGVKNRDDLKARLLVLFNKLAKDKNGNPVLDEGQELTRLEALALAAFKNSKNPKDFSDIVDILYGKDKSEINIDINIKAYKTVSPDDWDNAEDN